MIKLLKFIVEYLPVIFDQYGFIIKETKNSGNRFLGSSVLMASNEVEIFLAIERDDITVEFRSVFDKKNNNWYSIDIILAMLGHKNISGVLNDQITSIIREEIHEILNRFHESEIEDTLSILSKLEKVRSKG